MIIRQAAAKAPPYAKYVAERPHAHACLTAHTGRERLPSENISGLFVAQHVSLAALSTTLSLDCHSAGPTSLSSQG